MAINVVMVEDDNDVRESLSLAISSADDLNCIATFSNAEQFVDSFPFLKVDVVLMDINLPGEDGIQTVAKLKEKNPNIQYLMCTSFDDPQRTYDSLAAGATGYLLKNITPEKLREAIREIHGGGSPMSPEIARLVVASFTKKPAASANKIMETLSTREQEILQLLAEGFQYKEIANKLFVSIETVRTHVRNIYETLQVHSRTDAINKVFK
jgi:DNA-binding NarL/FixJ family response regulator